MTGDLFADLPASGGPSAIPAHSAPTPESQGPSPFVALDVDVAPGITLVEASAGTGKTYALTELVLRLVLDPEVNDLDDDGGVPDLRRLLVVTFTKAATEELKTRIRRALRVALGAFERGDRPDEAPDLVAPLVRRYGATEADRVRSVRRLRRALGQAGEAGVFTIHGFCKRVLERSAFESGEPFDFDFTEDADALRTRAARDVWHGLIAEFPGLGALAATSDWSLDGLLAHEKKATRFVDTAVLPAPPPLGDAFQAIDRARAVLGEAWDVSEQLAVVEPGLWSTAQKVIEFTGDLDGAFGRVRAFADGDWSHLGAVRDAQPEAVEKAIKSGSKAGKAAVSAVQEDAGFGACRDVIAAVEGLEHALVVEFIRRLGRASQALRERAGVLSFDDLIDRLYRALGPDAPTRAALVRSIQSQFSVALIDEFQDTDPKQYRIFRAAFEGRPLFFIGDPKQAIYAFRGADVFAYLEAKSDARQTFTLTTNYRSAPRLVGAVNAVFERRGPQGRPFVYDGIPFLPALPRAHAEAGIRGVEGPPMVWWSAGEGMDMWNGVVNKDNARDAAQAAVVAEITRLLNDPAVEVRDGDRWRRAEAGDLAVLVRTNRQARDIQDALREVGVPGVVGKGADIRTSREMEEIERVLRAVARPSDTRTVRAALATEMWGWTASDLTAEDADERVERIVGHLRRDRAVWRDHGVLRMLTGFFDRESVFSTLHAYRDASRRLTNLRHTVELLHDAETEAGRSPDELLQWVRTRESHSFRQEERVQMRLETDSDAVQLVTMHNAKGLEYPVVFVPFAWDDKADDKEFGAAQENPPVAHVEGGASAVYDLGSDEQAEHRALTEAERLAESLRLTYVAMTRARERLYVVWGPLSGGHMSGLGHLLRDLPVPLTDDGLAVLDPAAKSAAATQLKGAQAALADWVGSGDLGALMAVRPLPTGGEAVEARGAAAEALSARPVSPALARRAAAAATTGSFSAWASGIDTDARHDDAGAGPDRLDDVPEAGIFAFAAGARAGTCLHEVLQFADFRYPDALADPARLGDAPGLVGKVESEVTRILRRHGLHGLRPHRAPLDPTRAVCDMVASVASATVPGFGFALKDVASGRASRAVEWQFHAPRSPTAPAAIADVFETHGDDALRAYAPALRRLSTSAAEDLFTGIADLVVQHPPPTDDAPGGPFYLFDWKSNHLGPSAPHYGPEAIEGAMRQHHYILQAHLYAVGLHRHLRARLRDAYDPAVHFGGVAYVFLRGVAEDAATGFWTAHPAPALLTALDELLFADA